ncbi:MAG: hypothetical protein HY701_11160 [Gemmatimonadetes bacterium]|nr:hypothetical protein [Gemmatimonadota bacterium]
MGDGERSEQAHREERSNLELRERLEELLALARLLNRKRSLLTREQLEEVAVRMAWLSEEIYRAAVDPIRLVSRDE